MPEITQADYERREKLEDQLFEIRRLFPLDPNEEWPSAAQFMENVHAILFPDLHP